MQRSRDSEQEYVYTHEVNTGPGAQQKTNVPSPPPRYFLYYNPPPPRIYSIAECTFPPVARRARTFCEALVKPMSCNCYRSKYMSIQERGIYEMAYLELNLEPLLRRACVRRRGYTTKKLKQCTWISTEHIRRRWSSTRRWATRRWCSCRGGIRSWGCI